MKTKDIKAELDELGTECGARAYLGFVTATGECEVFVLEDATPRSPLYRVARLSHRWAPNASGPKARYTFYECVDEPDPIRRAIVAAWWAVDHVRTTFTPPSIHDQLFG